MNKRQLEQARKDFKQNNTTTSQLRTAVRADLAAVADAYDTAQQLLTQIQKMMANVEFDEKPYKALKDISGSLRDATQTLVQLRAEARESVAYAKQQHAAESAESAESAGVGTGTHAPQALTGTQVAGVLPEPQVQASNVPCTPGAAGDPAA